jgi:hypothetical protein
LTPYCPIKGLITYYVLFFIDLASRSVHIAGITPHPDNRWMTQIARNLTDLEEGFLPGTRHLILDRDAKYTDQFRNVLVGANAWVECSTIITAKLHELAQFRLLRPGRTFWTKRDSRSGNLSGAENRSGCSIIRRQEPRRIACCVIKANPAFDLVQPRAIGGREVRMKARAARQPSAHLRVFMRGVVIADQMHVEPLRNVRLDVSQEVQEFLVSTFFVALDIANGSVRRNEPRRTRSHSRVGIEQPQTCRRVLIRSGRCQDFNATRPQWARARTYTPISSLGATAHVR